MTKNIADLKIQLNNLKNDMDEKYILYNISKKKYTNAKNEYDREKQKEIMKEETIDTGAYILYPISAFELNKFCKIKFAKTDAEIHTLIDCKIVQNKYIRKVSISYVNSDNKTINKVLNGFDIVYRCFPK
jgi:hypothetical protein